MNTATKSGKRKKNLKPCPQTAEQESSLRHFLNLDETNRAKVSGRYDISAFAKHFLPHYYQVAQADFHREIYARLMDVVRRPEATRSAVAAPRKHAKTTTILTIFLLWCICYKKIANKECIVIASDTGPQAKERLEEIKFELEENEALAKAFPEAMGEGSKWTESKILTRNDIKISAVSTGSSMRGTKKREKEPDLLLGDDLENDENVNTLEQRDKSDGWFFKAFCKAGSSTADIFVLGTILHYDSLLSRILRNPTFWTRKYRGVVSWSKDTKGWEEWERIFTDWELDQYERERAADEYYQRNKVRMDEGAAALWPEWRSYYFLMKLRVAEGPASFDSEIQNEPINPDDCLFREEWFQWFDEDELETRNMPCVAAVDPSLGKAGKHGDPSAIVSIGRGSAGILYVLDADIRRIPPDEIIESCIELHDRRKLSALGVETVQFQEFFKDQLIKEASLRGKYPPIHGIEQTKDKVMRIQRLQPLVKSGRLRFQKKHKTLFEQLKYFPLADHDDGPDALEMAVQMIERINQSYGSGRGDKAGRRNGSDNLSRVFG